MLGNDFVEPRQSDYISPCIDVSKPNGTYGMCTDHSKNAAAV